MIAAFWPPGPEPITARSKSYVCSMAQASHERVSIASESQRRISPPEAPASRRSAPITTSRSVVGHMSGIEARRKLP